MKTTEHMSVSIRKDILKKLKELHKQSNYTSFSEWVDRIVLEPFIKENTLPIITAEIINKLAMNEAKKPY